jgi:hypothetical protein
VDTHCEGVALVAGFEELLAGENTHDGLHIHAFLMLAYGIDRANDRVTLGILRP